MAVCHNLRERKHKTFKGLAARQNFNGLVLGVQCAADVCGGGRNVNTFSKYNTAMEEMRVGLTSLPQAVDSPEIDAHVCILNSRAGYNEAFL